MALSFGDSDLCTNTVLNASLLVRSRVQDLVIGVNHSSTAQTFDECARVFGSKKLAQLKDFLGPLYVLISVKNQQIVAGDVESLEGLVEVDELHAIVEDAHA